MKQVALVHIDNLMPGMVLKGNVSDRSGRMLLPEAAELTAKHLVIFRTWGVLEVDIVGECDGEASGKGLVEEIPPARLAAAGEELGPLFMHNDLDNPAMKELFRICVARRAVHGE